MASFVQAASGTGADPASATFGSAITSGNWLFTFAFERSGGSLASGTAVISQGGTSTGWTQHIGRDTLLGDALHRRSFCAWSKVAGAGENTTITIDNGTTNSKAILIVELAPGGGETLTFTAAADNDNGTTESANSLATGTTASTSGSQLIWSVLCARNSGAGSVDPVSWSLGGSESEVNGGANGRFINAAWVASSATGTKSDTASCATNNTGLSAGIMVFNLDGGGGASAHPPAVIGGHLLSGNLRGLVH